MITLEDNAMKENNKNTENNEQGQSLIELAMSLVVLLILIAGLVDLGRAFFTYIALRDAAQEGASYAAVINSDTLESADVGNYCAAITNRVIITSETTNMPGISNGPIDMRALSDSGAVTIDTTINGTDCANIAAADICMGGAVSVSVNYDNFPITMPFLGAIIGRQSLPLSATVVDTILTPACD
jgi:Flp pilus assembly protein TadG